MCSAWGRVTALLAGACLLVAGCGNEGTATSRTTAKSGAATKRAAEPISRCPSARRVRRFVSYVRREGARDRAAGGAEDQPEVTLACLYKGEGTLSFYVADFGDEAKARFDALSLPFQDAPDDDEAEDREFDEIVDEPTVAGLVDVNFVGDLSVDGTKYLSGASGVVHNGRYICSVPLFGSAVNGQDGAELNAYLDGMLDLLRYACGAS
jgi:hypothetical protein